MFGMRILSLFTLLAISGMVHSKTIEGVEWPETLSVQGVKLVLNGAGLRTKRRLGMSFKVYVAGLYAPAVSSDAAALIASPEPRHLRLVFLRSLDKATLVEAFGEGFDKNCKFECDSARPTMKRFLESMIDVQEHDEMNVDFLKDGTTLSMKSGAPIAFGDGSFSKDLLSVFIGETPPTAELKAGLLQSH